MKTLYQNIYNRCFKISATISLVLGCVICSTGTGIAQQQPFNYTQYMNNLTPLNPTYALLDKAGQVNVVARKQWVGIEGSPSTFLFNGSIPFESINAAAGLMVSNDQFGVERQTQINGFFAKGISLGANSFLSVGMNFGFMNYSANYSNLDPTDPQFRNDVRETNPNIGFGLMFNTDNFYMGLSAPQLTLKSLGGGTVQNQAAFRNHYYFASAYLATLAPDIKLKPAVLFAYAQSIPMTVDLSGTVYFKNMVGVGMDYSSTKTASGILSVYASAFRLGYSYQFGTASNNAAAFRNATQEITVGFRFGKNSTKHSLL